MHFKMKSWVIEFKAFTEALGLEPVQQPFALESSAVAAVVEQACSLVEECKLREPWSGDS